MSRVPASVRVLVALIGTIALLSRPPAPTAPAWQPSGTDGVLVLDPFTTPAYVVSDAHAQGQAAFCHLRAGVWEPAAPDSDRLARAASADPVPAGTLVSVASAPRAGLGARWLDPARPKVIDEVLADRVSLCAAKGFDGVVATEVELEAYGPQFTAQDRHRLTRSLAAAALREGLLTVFIGHPRHVTRRT